MYSSYCTFICMYTIQQLLEVQNKIFFSSFSNLSQYLPIFATPSVMSSFPIILTYFRELFRASISQYLPTSCEIGRNNTRAMIPDHLTDSQLYFCSVKLLGPMYPCAPAICIRLINLMYLVKNLLFRLYCSWQLQKQT